MLMLYTIILRLQNNMDWKSPTAFMAKSCSSIYSEVVVSSVTGFWLFESQKLLLNVVSIVSYNLTIIYFAKT